MSIAIQVNNLYKTYPTNPPVDALTGISLDVQDGETIGILGPNGAGKTTLVRILAGLLLPDRGTVQVRGIDPAKQPQQVAQWLRLVPETPFLNHFWTLWQNARFWSTVWDEKWDPTTLKGIFRRFGLLERAGEPLAYYSRGMQQKACLALVLNSTAPIIILDEPTLGLDVLAVQEVVDILRTLKASGKTILFASHDMSFVEKVADRIILMAKGSVLDIDSVHHFRDRYAQRRTIVSYCFPGEKHVTQKTIYNEQFPAAFIQELLMQGAQIMELRHELQSMEEVVRQFFRENEPQGDDTYQMTSS